MKQIPIIAGLIFVVVLVTTLLVGSGFLPTPFPQAAIFPEEIIFGQKVVVDYVRGEILVKFKDKKSLLTYTSQPFNLSALAPGASLSIKEQVFKRIPRRPPQEFCFEVKEGVEETPLPSPTPALSPLPEEEFIPLPEEELFFESSPLSEEELSAQIFDIFQRRERTPLPTSIPELEIITKQVCYTAVELEVMDPTELSPEAVFYLKKIKRQKIAAVTADKLGLDRWVVLNINNKQTDPQVLSDQLSKHPAIEFAEPNLIAKTQLIPNDSLFNRLWGIKKIEADKAWDVNQGEGIVVAISDTGIDYTHEDLAANIWENTGEIPNNGVDDDNNGFIDDVRGWDFYNGDNIPLDDNGHGTHVAGTVAAVGNNRKGVIGVASRAKLMAVKGLSAGGSGSIVTLGKGIRYAADNGADVINMSWGGFGGSQYLYNILDYANSLGVVTVAAAGNSNLNAAIFFPANHNGTIAVAATTEIDQKAFFSNYGGTIDVAAPGDNILSTLPFNRYISYRGTSMAAPHVSGVVALILSDNNDFSINEVKRHLLYSVDLITPNRPYIGSGRINAKRAVIGPLRSNLPPALRLIQDQSIGTDETLSLTLFAIDLDGDDLTYSVSNLPIGASFNPSTRTFSWTPTALQVDNHTVSFSVTDGQLSDTLDVRIEVLEPDEEISLPFSDNFNRSAPSPNSLGSSWVNKNGSFGIANNKAVRLSGVPALVTVKGLSVGEVNVSAEANFKKITRRVSTLMLVARYQGSVADGLGSQNFYMATIRSSVLKSLRIYKRTANSWVLLASSQQIRATSGTLDFKVVGNTLEASFGGTTITATDNSFATGEVGMIAFSKSIVFDNFRAETPSEEENRSPVFKSVSDKTVIAGNTLTFQISATDPDGDSLTYSSTQLPTGSNFNVSTRTFSWTPTTAEIGNNRAKFRVSDPEGLTDDLNVNIEVEQPNRPPEFDSDQSVEAGKLLTFTIHATDPDDDSLTYSSTQLPSGSNFNASTRTFSWTPTTAQVGNHQSKFEVSDPDNAKDALTVNIAVSAPQPINQAPDFQAIANQTITVGSNLIFQIEATDPDGDSLTYSATSLPQGAVFNASIRTFSWTPMTLQVGNHTASFSVTDGQFSDTLDVTIEVKEKVVVTGKIYWSEGNASGKIMTADLNGANPQEIITGQKHLQGLAVDGSNQKFYWINLLSGINRSNLDGANIESIIAKSGLSSVVVDSAGGKIYYTNISQDTIYRANLNGSGEELLLSRAVLGGNFANPRNIILYNGKMYWLSSRGWQVNTAGPASIQRANLDGSGLENVINQYKLFSDSNDYMFISSFAIEDNKIYFDDLTRDRILTSNLDGGGIIDLITGIEKPSLIHIDASQGKIYWADVISAHDIYQANLNGSNVEVIIDLSSRPGDITVISQ